MAAHKPHNHVTRKMDRERAERLATAPCPEIPLDLLEWLEAVFPPRCYKPGVETLEAHLLYAGQARLVVNMRNDFENQRSAPSEDSIDLPMDDGDDAANWDPA